MSDPHGPAYCPWCQWDSPNGELHPECKIKWDRRADLEKLVKPMLAEVGIDKPYFHNLLTDLCLRIERRLDDKDDISG
jgi:hypothetical protein